MLQLLTDLKSPGYPDDFLLARLHGRAARQVEAAGDRLRQPIDPWATLQAEVSWLHATMNRPMRRRFGYCFLQFELRRLLIALRRLSGHSRAGLEQLTVRPLLQPSLLQQLLAADDVATAARRLDAALAQAGVVDPGLERMLQTEGSRRMEEVLIDLFFRQAVRHAASAPLRDYFSAWVDLHNLMALAKARRWQLDAPVPLLAGGSVTPEQWRRWLRPGRERTLARAISRVSGSAGEDPESVEHALLSRGRRRLHRRARSDAADYQVLDYFWRQALRARNLGLQQWAGERLAAWESLG